MKNTKLNFLRQDVYVGIDVHKNRWIVTIRFLGMELMTISMNPDPEELVRYLRKNYPGAIYHTVYEAGFCGFWIDRTLREAGIDNIVVNPADVPSTHKEKRRKTDKIDSRKLAKELSVEHLEGIYIPSRENEAIRSLSRLRVQLTKDQTRLKLRIISLLHFSGVKIPEHDEIKHWSANFIKYLSELEFPEKEKKMTLIILLKSLQQTREQIVGIVRELRKVVREDNKTKKIIECLLTIPGIGFITAVTLYTEIIDIKRFRKFDQLVAFVGFAPDTNSSGENDKVIGITQRKQAYLRNLLIEAAWMSVRKDPAMTAAFAKLTQRMIKQRAIIRIAKKLVSRIMYVWTNERDYVFSVVS
jgi:transposase